MLSIQRDNFFWIIQHLFSVENIEGTHYLHSAILHLIFQGFVIVWFSHQATPSSEPVSKRSGSCRHEMKTRNEQEVAPENSRHEREAALENSTNSISTPTRELVDAL